SYQKHITPQRFQLMWNNVLTKGGTFKKTNEMIENVQSNYSVVIIPAVFEKRTTNVKFIFNRLDRIVGINFLPDEKKEWYKVPAYYDSAKVNLLDVKINSGDYSLPGTLSLPNPERKS